MPGVKDLRERTDKFIAKTAADRVGTRYDAVKNIAVGRFTSYASSIVEFRELVRIVLNKEGIPAGQQGPYYAFAMRIRSKAFSHSGTTLKDYVNGIIQDFVTGKGCDPTVLKKIASMLLGEVIS